MKALVVRQPWASLIAHGIKTKTASDLPLSGSMESQNEGGPGAGETAPDRGQHLVGGAVMAHDSSADRFWAKVDKAGPTDCWEWQASRQERGHGLFRIGSRTDGSTRLVKAHRFAYELLVGPIPDGLALDHLCSNPPCVNPAHLEPVTRGENSRREADRRETCRRGHPWSENVVSVGKNRTCAVCLVGTRERKNAARRQRRANGSGE